MVSAGAAAIDVGDERVLIVRAEVCLVTENAFSHGRTADIPQADEEDRDGVGR